LCQVFDFEALHNINVEVREVSFSPFWGHPLRKTTYVAHLTALLNRFLAR
jgi:hypothetical protein